MTRQKKNRRISLSARNALRQAKISIILMAVIPCLSLFYLGQVTSSGRGSYSFPTLMLIVLLTIAVALPGFYILRKYPKNIMKLRQYITDISKGTLPARIELENAQSSDDLKYIEDHFNRVLEEMKKRITRAEKQAQIEQSLKETIERQQQALLEAERHRAMIQTIGATCHHIGQPAAVLQLRLDLLQTLVTNQESREEVEGCVKAVTQLTDILHQLQRVSEFRTAPYIHTENIPDDEILVLSPEAPSADSIQSPLSG